MSLAPEGKGTEAKNANNFLVTVHGGYCCLATTAVNSSQQYIPGHFLINRESNTVKHRSLGIKRKSSFGLSPLAALVFLGAESARAATSFGSLGRDANVVSNIASMPRTRFPPSRALPAS
jgi:hypothetical protein